jgi:hypothetical protein
MHIDMVVTRESIHEAEQSIPGSRVDQRIYGWEKEAVFWIGFVEVGEVHSHLPFPIEFFYQEYVG